MSIPIPNNGKRTPDYSRIVQLAAVCWGVIGAFNMAKFKTAYNALTPEDHEILNAALKEIR
jgi:hypothetical protein